ncbi:hypothetical protein MGA5115_00813 [Marinomonas gallaica]|uniref:Lipoprotein n=1 Tax=Marinomonas gallaica TaxID=1806667 RepID=A0A1C3JNJ2_9GAMM|nr:hypothetical protein [Marinomonas gallaica]SBT16731.1 hypothetical protein MGA5115_00813 [Marinomonas gallaica]SBT20447.1 hypothetical protein MGA5116_01031 [Marinomonas gallaica]
MHKPYSHPFPNLKSAFLSLGLMFTGCSSPILPFLNLKSFLSSDQFSAISMICVYIAFLFFIMISFALRGVKSTKYIILIILYSSLLVSAILHLYLLKKLPDYKIYFYAFSVFLNIIAIGIAHSKQHTILIKYRKEHIKYGKKLRKEYLNKKKRA